MKSSIVEFIEEVKFYNDDVIYLTLNFLPDIPFCECYSTLADSHYYEISVFANINSTVMESSNLSIIVGDFNAKVKNHFDLVIGCDDSRYIESSDVNK